MATDSTKINYAAAKLKVDRTWALLRTLQDTQSYLMHALFLLDAIGRNEVVRSHLNDALDSLDDPLDYAATEYHEACTNPK